MVEKKSISGQMTIDSMQQRLDISLNKMKDDTDKVQGKSDKLFTQFMDQVYKVDTNYDKCNKKMIELQDYFEKNR